MSFFESRLAMVLVVFLENYLKGNPLGFVVGPDAQTRIVPGRIRIPDVSFSRWEMTPDGRVPMDPIGPFAPELAVEILSPGNTKREMALKISDYFGAGTKLVWIVDSKTCSATIYRSPESSRTVDAEGELDGEDLLPGFRLGLKEWFETATGQRRGETK
jgi:Uma2 family endonuclease